MRDTVYLFRFLFPRKHSTSTRLQLSLLQNFRGIDEVEIPKPYETIGTPRSSHANSRYGPSTAKKNSTTKKLHTDPLTDENSSNFANSNSENYQNETQENPLDCRSKKPNMNLNLGPAINGSNNNLKKKVPSIGPLNISGLKQRDHIDKVEMRVGIPIDGMNRLGGNASNDRDRERELGEYGDRGGFDDGNLEGGNDSDRFGNKFSDSDDEMGTSSRDFREEARDTVKEIPKFNIPIHRIPKFDDRDQPDINDVFNAEKTGDYGNIRQTQRSEIKIQYFSGKCSEIIKGFLYLGGQTIANNQRILKEEGITHILNCAGDYCENKFPDKFIYKTYFLKDCKTENIEAVFYDSIKFLSEVKEKGGRVFVHCVKGVSRYFLFP